MRPSRLLVSALSLVVVAPAYAQLRRTDRAPAPLPARSTEAATLLHRAFASVAGGGTPIKDITLTGTARRIAGSDDETGTAVLKALATGESRIDLSFPSGQRREVHANSDKGPVGFWSGPDGAEHRLSLFNILVDSAWFSPALMISKLALSADTVASASTTENLDATAVEHVTVSRQFPQAPAPTAPLMQLHSQMEIYLDAASLRPHALGFNTHPDVDMRRNMPVEIRYSDYRVVEGVAMPFHVQKYINGSLILDLEFEKAELNVGLSTSSFNIPEQMLAPRVFRPLAK